MNDSREETSYLRAEKRLLTLIPQKELYEKLCQYGCELDRGFLGFLDTYDAVARFVPRSMVVVDFGCYMAAQAYFFKRHRAYIGVDFYERGNFPNLKRFEPANSIMLIQSIQEAVRILPASYYAICSAVNDNGARELVSRMYPNHCIRYPGMLDDIEGIHADEIEEFIHREDDD